MQVAALPVLDRKIPVYEILGEESLERIHQASLDILEQVGIEFRDAEATRMWRDAGAEVDRYRVRIPGPLLMGLIAKNPERFTVRARNPERSTEIGGNKVAFAPTYGSPFVQATTTSVATAPLPICKSSTSSPIWRRRSTTPAP